MFSVCVRGDEHLTVRPRLLLKFPCHLVCQASGDVFVWREGLDIVIEPDRAVLPVHLPGGNKLLGGQLGRGGVAVLGDHVAAHVQQGIGGLALAALLTVPLGGVFGFLIGKLLNRMKGQEMIGSMILGYFANGLYQLLFLFIFDNIIPIHNPNLTIKGSTGIANTMDLSREGGFAYSLEKLWQLPASQAALVFAAVAAVLLVAGYLVSHRRNAKKLAVQLCVIAAAAAVMQLPAMKALFSMVSVPMATFGVVALLCLFNVVIMRTRLGQQLRAVGQSGVVANAAGIDVDRVRIIAIVFSTILAGWGQLIFVQNMGSFQTYGAHEQVGLYAGAAILVGGASVIRATNTQALVGCVLFHLMFILAPAAGKNLFGDAAIGEYFRVFICYGVIALALVMHAWSENSRRKQAASALRAGGKA